MKCCIIGNCQVEPIFELLNTSESFNEKYLKTDVYKIFEIPDPEELFKSLNDYDTIIIQPVSESYIDGKFSVKRMLDNFPREKLIFIVNSYFNGYHPEMIYLYDINGGHINHYNVDYHDKNIFIGHYENKELKNYPEDPDFYTKEQSWNLVEINIKNLKERENNMFGTNVPVDIKISDYIESNFQKKRLFNTFNHPATPLLFEVTNRILNYLKLPNDIIHPKKELLNDVIFPIYKSTQKNLELEFSEPITYKMKKRKYSYEEILSLYVNYYTNVLKSYTVNNNYKWLNK